MYIYDKKVSHMHWRMCLNDRDVNIFWSSKRKLKSSRQIDADDAAVRRAELARRPLQPGIWG
jgi:hypothetical protein